MNDCYDLYVSNLWIDMHEKYVILELIWWNGKEPCLIYESIWLQMLPKSYVGNYVVIYDLDKVMNDTCSMRILWVTFEYMSMYLMITDRNGAYIMIDMYLMYDCITYDIKGGVNYLF